MIRLVLALLCGVGTLAAQRPGLELLVYPAGIIGVVRGDVTLASRWSLDLVGGVNVTDRGDWGVHLDESGWGLGGGVGVSWHPRPTGWWVGGRLDGWALSIDWADLPTQPRGTTDVLVVQPTVRAGWRWLAGRAAIDVTLALGREVNVRTAGQPVGEGWIGLAGLGVVFGR